MKRLAKVADAASSAKSPPAPAQTAQKFLGNDFMKERLAGKQAPEAEQKTDASSKSMDRELYNVLFNLGMDPRIVKGIVQAIGALADTRWDPMATLAWGPNGIQLWEPGIGMQVAEMFQLQLMIEDIKTPEFLQATIGLFIGAPIVGVQPEEMVMYWKRIGFRADVADEMGNLLRAKLGLREDPKTVNPQVRQKLMGSMGRIPAARYEA